MFLWWKIGSDLLVDRMDDVPVEEIDVSVLDLLVLGFIGAGQALL